MSGWRIEPQKQCQLPRVHQQVREALACSSVAPPAAAGAVDKRAARKRVSGGAVAGAAGADFAAPLRPEARRALAGAAVGVLVPSSCAAPAQSAEASESLRLDSYDGAGTLPCTPGSAMQYRAFPLEVIGCTPDARPAAMRTARLRRGGGFSVCATAAACAFSCSARPASSAAALFHCLPASSCSAAGTASCPVRIRRPAQMAATSETQQGSS